MQTGILAKYISILYRQEQKYINHVLSPYGLGYSSYKFLLYLSRNEGCSQKQMCRNMVIDEALATRVMKKLEEQGYVCREKGNGRTYQLFLSEKARELVPKIRQAVAVWWGNLTETWTKQQMDWVLQELPQMIEKANDMIEQIGEDEDGTSQTKSTGYREN